MLATYVACGGLRCQCLFGGRRSRLSLRLEAITFRDLSVALRGTIQLEEWILSCRNHKIGYRYRDLIIIISVPNLIIKLTLSMAGSSVAVRSAGRADIQPSLEPNPAHTSSRRHVHKSSRLDHEKAPGTMYISAVVLVESRP